MQNPTTKHPGFIYVVWAKGSPMVKIGYSRKSRSRLQSLQTGNAQKLEILFQYPGSIATEKILHEKFSAFRLEGEWFSFPAFSGYEIYQAIIQAAAVQFVEQKEEVSKRKIKGRKKLYLPKKIDHRIENGAVVLYRREASMSQSGKRSSRRTYIGRIPAKAVSSILQLNSSEQRIKIEEHIQNYETRKKGRLNHEN